MTVPHKYRLIGGEHLDRNPDGSWKSYRRGDIVESTIDLCARFANKFERVHGEATPLGPITEEEIARRGIAKAQAPEAPEMMPVKTAPLPPPPALETLDLKQLREFAEEREIDLKGAKDKDAILKILKGK